MADPAFDERIGLVLVGLLLGEGDADARMRAVCRGSSACAAHGSSILSSLSTPRTFLRVCGVVESMLNMIESSSISQKNSASESVSVSPLVLSTTAKPRRFCIGEDLAQIGDEQRLAM